MKRMIAKTCVYSILFLSFAATAAEGSLDDCLAQNKDSDSGQTSCYGQFVKQAQQKGKEKFQTDLQKNYNELKAATQKANNDQLQKQNQQNPPRPPASTAVAAPVQGSSNTPVTTTEPSTMKVPSTKSSKIEEEQPKSIPYY